MENILTKGFEEPNKYLTVVVVKNTPSHIFVVYRKRYICQFFPLKICEWKKTTFCGQMGKNPQVSFLRDYPVRTMLITVSYVKMMTTVVMMMIVMTIVMVMLMNTGIAVSFPFPTVGTGSDCVVREREREGEYKSSKSPSSPLPANPHLHLDKAPPLSIRVVIWTLPSDTDTLFGDNPDCISK